jgi:predicted permease
VTKPGPLSRAAFRGLLWLYPAAFRARYETALEDAFEAQAAEPRYRGVGGTVRFWMDMVRDTLLGAGQQRWDQIVGGARGSSDSRHGMRGRERVMDGFRQDLRFALRSLRRSPGFAAIAVLTLALGIGANTAIFSAVNGVLLRPLPYGEPDDLVTVWSQWQGFPKTWVSMPEYINYVQQNQALDDIALWSETSATFTDPDNPERVRAASVTGNLLSVLQVQPAVGRFFNEAEILAVDTVPTDVVLVGYGTWQRRYGGDPAAVGRRIEVNGRTRTLIGVMPVGFRLPTEFGQPGHAEVFFPRYVDRDAPITVPHGGGSHGFNLAARLAPGATPERARQDLERVVDELKAQDVYREGQRFNVLVFPLSADVLGTLRPALLVLTGAVAFVLLIACANVANLLLSRSRSRQGELSVRAALGAGRGRLVRQLLTESVVLAALGGGAGVALAYGGTTALRRLDPGTLPRIADIDVDGSALFFACLVTLLTAFLFGALPALRAARSNLADGLGERAQSGGGGGSPSWQSVLVAAEMALAVVLVVGAGLMLRTFGQLTGVDRGWSQDNVVTMQVNLSQANYPEPDQVVGFWEEAVRRVGELPGVQMASAVRSRPLVDQIGDWGLNIEGYQPGPDEGVNGDWQIVAPGYPEAMGIPLVRGRTIEPGDGMDAPVVAMVNEAMVRAYWPNEDPVGKRFQVGRGLPNRPWVTVVGVLGDVTHNGLTAEIKRKFYIPLSQWHLATGSPRWSMALVVRTAGDPATVAPAVRSQLRAMDPTVPMAEVMTVDDIVTASVAQPRFTMVLLAVFAGIALLLALVGIYGVISDGVSQRTREIGIRMALGAQEGQVVSMVVRQGLVMAGAGLAIGLAISLGLTRFLESLLFGVTATDRLTFAAVAVGFIVVALLATWTPALRAARVRPMTALRSE